MHSLESDQKKNTGRKTVRRKRKLFQCYFNTYLSEEVFKILPRKAKTKLKLQGTLMRSAVYTPSSFLFLSRSLLPPAPSFLLSCATLPFNAAFRAPSLNANSYCCVIFQRSRLMLGYVKIYRLINQLVLLENWSQVEVWQNQYGKAVILELSTYQSV